MYTATYSPDDNKLRLYASQRLDPDEYARVRAAGFRWAPKQDLFVAPMWTPAREDVLLTLVDSIDDEDTSLVDRAEARADRFDDYHDHRMTDADSAHRGAQAICDVVQGQPILIGHHSERRARRDAEKVQNGFRKASQCWQTAEYWTARAAGARRHAAYVERPDVRARRIKRLEADERKNVRATERAATFADLWSRVETMEHALTLADHSYGSKCYPLADYPREPPASQYEGQMGLWSALKDGVLTMEQARSSALEANSVGEAFRDRWAAHYAGRLAYERVRLEDAGRVDLLKPKPRPKHPPLWNYRADAITCPNRYNAGETITYAQVEMTAAEYAAINTDYKGTNVCQGTHRIRTAMQRHTLVCVFLTDRKTHPGPA